MPFFIDDAFRQCQRRPLTHVRRYLSGLGEDPRNDTDDGENVNTETPATIESADSDATVPSSLPTESRAMQPLREKRMPNKYDL